MSINERKKELRPRPGGYPRTEPAAPAVRLPPHALELEEAVLGAMILEKDKQTEVLGILPTEACFYSDANRKVYAAIKRLADRRTPVDLLTLTAELRRSEELELIGGAYYLTRLTMSVVSSAHVEAHARIVQEKYLSRELIRISGDVLQSAYEDGDDVFEQLDHIESELFLLSAANFKTQYRSAPELASMMRNMIVSRVQAPDTLSGVSTGYRALDRLTNGLDPCTLTIIAARPSVGKTAFALNLAMNIANSSGGAGFFSLEMPTASVMNRITSSMADVPLKKILRGNLADWEQQKVFDAIKLFEGSNLKVDDAAALSVYELRSKGRRMVDEGAAAIVVDYLQLMSGGNDKKSTNREQEVAKISRDLKGLSKDLNVPVIALSQLNRSSESKGSREPQLSDLRESGAIEQDADMVMFLSRPDYQKGQDEVDPSIRDDAYIHVAKSRQGETDKIAMRFMKDVQRWMDVQEYEKYKADRMFDTPSPAVSQYDNPRAGFPVRDFTQPKSAQEDDETPF